MSADKKKTRAKFRSEVFTRDGEKCLMCGISCVALDAHHITPREEMPNGGYVKENGISVCNLPGGCHEKAEEFYSKGVSFPGYAPEDLYKKIGSNLEKAIAASKKLK